jgi:hypothetical protein
MDPTAPRPMAMGPTFTTARCQIRTLPLLI